MLFDAEPVIENGRTLVPFRAILEAMGANVTYDSRTQTVTARKSGTTVQMVIGKTTATLNGRTVNVPDGVAPKIIKNRTFIPLRFISESMGMRVTWEPTERVANIIDNAFPKRGGTLQLAMWSAPAGNFNPVMYDDAYDENIVGLIFDGLWYFDSGLQPRPSIARYWEVSPDNLKVTFHLRKNVRFHDGQPLTSEDVRFTFEAIMHPDYKGVRNVGYEAMVGYDDFHSGKTRTMAGIATPDPYTVTFQLKEPYAPFFTDNTGFGIIPKHKYRSIPLADWGTARDPNIKKPIGAGAFKFASMAPSQFYMLDAYENYHLGRPYVDHLIYKVLSQDTALAQMEVGAIDMAEFGATDLPALQKMSHIQVFEYPDLVYQYLGFNHKKAPFDDKAVRQAAAYAIDTRALVNDLLGGHAGRLYTHMHPLYWSYTENVEHYDYNPAKAEQLLDAAGWKKGADGIRVKDGKKLSVELLYPIGNQVRERSAPIIQQWLKAVGFDVTLSRLEFATLVTRVFDNHDTQAWLMAWEITTDPDPKGIFDKSQMEPGLFNGYQWYSPRAQELMDAAVKTLDIEKRRAYYQEWQQIFADELPLYPLYAPNTIVGFNKRVQNTKPSVAGTMWNVYEVWLSR